MGKTNKAKWEKAKNALLTKGITQEQIDTLLSEKEENKDKFEALKPLLNDNGIELNQKKETAVDNTPTLLSFFGKIISDLLIERKQLLQIKSVNINDIESKIVKDLSVNDLVIFAKYKEFKSAEKRISEIEELLADKGIKFVAKKEATSKV